MHFVFKTIVWEKRFMQYTELGKQALLAERDSILSLYRSYCGQALKLDLSRGKPAAEQLDLSMGMLNLPFEADSICAESGLDCRNYGAPDGIPEMRAFWSEVTGIPAEQIIIGGNSSLALMYDTVARAMLYGVANSPRPWCTEPKRKFLCPAPGYDRHFAITESLGFELIPVAMREDGPDMDELERLAADPTVKGVWCVPKYANPTGITYSDEVVRRFAAMKTGAPDFTVMWDNAYAVHDLCEDGDCLADVFALAKEYGTENRFFYFCSTSKITFPGSGVAMLAASPENLAVVRRVMGVQTIGYDKLNQLRHLRFLTDREGVLRQMRLHASIIREKFDLLNGILDHDLSGLGIAEWSHPKGGYFISLNVMDGTAKRVYALAKEAGVTLTAVGATYPYGHDPHDRNLRLAPTYPSLGELKAAGNVLTAAVRLAALEKLLG